MALGIAAHGVQTRFNISFKTLKPKFDRLNPISGIKKMFAEFMYPFASNGVSVNSQGLYGIYNCGIF